MIYMRISPDEIKIIKETAQKYCGKSVEVYFLVQGSMIEFVSYMIFLFVLKILH